jgi:hypothetical protein
MLSDMTETVAPKPAPSGRKRRSDIPADTLAGVQALYDAGLCRQAYELAVAMAPLAEWDGVEARILAGRIALNMGAPRLASRHHTGAFHAASGQIRTQAYYLEVVLGMRGPVFAWEKFAQFEPAHNSTGALEDHEGWEYLFTLGARICGLFRDFSRAEHYLKVAERYPSNSPWLLVEQAGVLGMRERWGEAANLARERWNSGPGTALPSSLSPTVSIR